MVKNPDFEKTTFFEDSKDSKNQNFSLLFKNIPVFVWHIFPNKTTPGNSHAPLYLEGGWIYSEWETYNQFDTFWWTAILLGKNILLLPFSS